MAKHTSEYAREASRKSYYKKRGLEAPKSEVDVYEEKLDVLTDWLIDHNFEHPEWDAKVSEFHQVEHKIKVATAVKSNLSGGIVEFSIPKSN